jgi:DNA-binding response OmpR family regulator
MDVELSQTPAAHAVLVALPDGERAAEVARALAAERLMPVMAFTRDALLKFAAGGLVAAVVVDLALDADVAAPGPPLLQAVGAVTAAPVVLLGFVPGAGADVLTTGAQGLLGVDASAADVVGTVLTALARHRRDAPIVTCGELTVDLQNFEAWHGPDRLAVTPTELRLLAALAAARGDVVTKPDLQRAAWGTAGAHDDNRLQAHMRRLRAKLDGTPGDTCRVRTVRGVGFRLELLPAVPPGPVSGPAPMHGAGAIVHEATGFGTEPWGRRR